MRRDCSSLIGCKGDRQTTASHRAIRKMGDEKLVPTRAFYFRRTPERQQPTRDRHSTPVANSGLGSVAAKVSRYSAPSLTRMSSVNIPAPPPAPPAHLPHAVPAPLTISSD